MRKTADEIADEVLGQEAVARKTKERWISALVGGAIGAAGGLASRNLKPSGLPFEAVSTGLMGLLTANAPNAIWKNPEENASDPRWWRKDYSPMEHGVALGVGSGLGVTGGHFLMKALKNRGIVSPAFLESLKGAPVSIGVMLAPAMAGFLAARKLMQMRDERRDA